jgi:hypothetical protein
MFLVPWRAVEIFVEVDQTVECAVMLSQHWNVRTTLREIRVSSKASGQSLSKGKDNPASYESLAHSRAIHVNQKK